MATQRQLKRGGKDCPNCGQPMDRRAKECVKCYIGGERVGAAGRRFRCARLLKQNRAGISAGELADNAGITTTRIYTLLAKGRIDEKEAGEKRGELIRSKGRGF